MSYISKYVVFIGRFEPFHMGHQGTVQEALLKGEHVIVLIGSSLRPRSPKNPWTAREREEMIRSSFSKEDNERLSIRYIEDRYNSVLWSEDVKSSVKNVIEKRGDIISDVSVRIIGREKDSSTYYLNIFPEWSPVLEIHSCDSLSATELRDFLFFGGDGGLSLIKANVSNSVYEMLKTFKEYSFAFHSLKSDAAISRHEKIKNKGKILSIVSLVIKKEDKFFLTKRSHAPGLGLLNLPNIDYDNTKIIYDVVFNLMQKIDTTISVDQIQKSIQKIHVFDEPDRSEYGRISNHVVFIDFKDVEENNFNDGYWFEIKDVNKLKEHLFEDDYRTLRFFLQ